MWNLLIFIYFTKYRFFWKQKNRFPPRNTPHLPTHHNKVTGRRGFENEKIKSPGEALSTFIRASRDPKGEQQVWVAKSIRNG